MLSLSYTIYVAAGVVVSTAIAATINGLLASRMYAADAYDTNTNLFTSFPNNLAGDVAVTTFVQTVITWIVSCGLAFRDGCLKGPIFVETRGLGTSSSASHWDRLGLACVGWGAHVPSPYPIMGPFWTRRVAVQDAEATLDQYRSMLPERRPPEPWAEAFEYLDLSAPWSKRLLPHLAHGVWYGLTWMQLYSTLPLLIIGLLVVELEPVNGVGVRGDHIHPLSLSLSHACVRVLALALFRSLSLSLLLALSLSVCLSFFLSSSLCLSLLSLSLSPSPPLSSLTRARAGSGVRAPPPIP